MGDFVPKLKRLVNQPSGRLNGSDEGGRDMSGNGIAPSGSSATASGYRISLIGGALDVSARLSTPEELELLVKVLEANKVLWETTPSGQPRLQPNAKPKIEFLDGVAATSKT
jgi:hypothetical protein